MSSDTQSVANAAVVSVDDLPRLIRGPLGLIIGSAATTGPGTHATLIRRLSEAFDVAPKDQLLATVDDLLERGVDVSEIRRIIRQAVESLLPIAQVNELAKPNWRAIVTTTLDTTFELALRQRLDRSPASRTVTALSDLTVPLPPRTLPIFCLLGSKDRSDFVVSSNDYRVRRTAWRPALHSFAAHVKGNPVLCIGFEETAWFLLDVLAEIIHDPACRPGPIILLEEDPLRRDRALSDLAGRGIRLLHLEATLGQLIAAIAAGEKSDFTGHLPFDGTSRMHWQALAHFSELAVPVNTQTDTAVDITETNLLHNLLFSPTTPRWDPYVHNLDLPRTAAEQVVSEIRRVAGREDESNAVLVSGAAACGKTTILKRAALELATEEHLVLWMRPYFYQDGAAALLELMKLVAAGKFARGKSLIIFVDDPLSLGSVQTQDIVGAVTAAGLRATFVLGLRTTDLELMDPATTIGSLAVGSHQQIPEVFDDTEWDALPGYLLKLGVAQNTEEATARVADARGGASRDILAMLFWLLPETRQSIRKSIHAEYLRLGDRAAFSRLIVGELNRTSQMLKDAYEYVAVADHFDSPVPIEVLVSALGVSYEDWLAAARDEGLAWGLLYAEESPRAESTVYRTRNSVVTDIIIEAVNGGTVGHSGELQRLGHLVRACTGASPAYREFCVRVLVPYSRNELRRLEYAEGRKLYEDANAAIPMQDRTLVHHQGLWEKNRGHDPTAARKTLRRALDTTEYPYSSRGEPSEHIHTSLAATELDAIRLRETSPNDGRAAVLHHLDRARSEVFVNPNAVHVQARLTLDLVDLAGTYGEPDSVALVNAALADVDRAIMLLRSPFARRRVSTEALEDVHSKLFERFGSLEQMRSEAVRIWAEFKRQDGFVLVGRRLYSSACRTNRGRNFNEAFQYCRDRCDQIRQADQVPGVPLSETMLHIYYQWRVRRGIHSESSDPIDWAFIRDVADAVRTSDRSRSDPFYHYLYAVSEAHLGEWRHADAIFHELRRRGMPGGVLWEPRDCLLNESGGMRQVQGVIKKGGDGLFLKVEFLGRDFRVERNDRWPAPDQVAHAYVRFRYGGTIATTEY